MKCLWSTEIQNYKHSIPYVSVADLHNASYVYKCSSAETQRLGKTLFYLLSWATQTCGYMSQKQCIFQRWASLLYITATYTYQDVLLTYKSCASWNTLQPKMNECRQSRKNLQLEPCGLWWCTLDGQQQPQLVKRSHLFSNATCKTWGRYPIRFWV